MNVVELTAGLDQKDYTVPELVGKDVALVCLPPAVIDKSSGSDGYTYTSATGTVSFGTAPQLNQKIIILYKDVNE